MRKCKSMNNCSENFYKASQEQTSRCKRKYESHDSLQCLKFEGTEKVTSGIPVGKRDTRPAAEQDQPSEYKNTRIGLPGSSGFDSFESLDHSRGNIHPVVQKALHQLFSSTDPLSSASLSKEHWIELVDLSGCMVFYETDEENYEINQLINTMPDEGCRKQLVERWPEVVRNLPPGNQSLELWKIAIGKDGTLTNDLPEQYSKNWEVWELACMSYSQLNFWRIPAETKMDNPERYRDLCLIAISDRSDNIQYVDSNSRTDEMWKIACKKDGSCIQFFDATNIESKKGFYLSLCRIACNNPPDRGVGPIYYIKLSIFDFEIQMELCRQVIKKKPSEYKYFPRNLKNDRDLAIFSVNHSGKNYQFIQTCFKNDWGICELSLTKEPSVLKHIPNDLIRKNYNEMFEILKKHIKKDPCAIRYFPEWLITGNEAIYSELCEIAGKYHEDVFSLINPKFQTKEFFARLVGYHAYAVASVMHKMPKDKKAYNYHELCELACAENGMILEVIPDKSLKLCIIACKQSPKAISSTPEPFLESVLLQCPQAKYYLTDMDSPGFTKESACRQVLLGKGLRHQLLKASKASNEIKKAVIDFMIHPTVPFPTVNGNELYRRVNPCQFVVECPFLEELVFSCYKNQRFQPWDFIESQKLIDYVKINQPAVKSLLDGTPVLNLTSWEICGGRTLRLKQADDQGEMLQHYKFQRKGESLNDLFREGLTYAFFEEWIKKKPAPVNPFKSSWPKHHDFIRFPSDRLPEEIKTGFEDALEFTKDENEIDYVYAYGYKARRNYCRYAHTPDDKSDTPFAQAETGLLNSVHDIGRLASMGILLTNTLPAFHDRLDGRRWVMLSSPMGRFYDLSTLRRLDFPGNYNAWNTVATERPDFGYDGLRDIGDFEIFGKVSQLFEIEDIQAVAHPSRVMQLLALANTLAENVLAVCLLYARLHQGSQDYHHLSLEAITASKLFIENAFNELLTGFLPPEKNPGLQKILNVNGEDYRGWLQRTALEFLYCTAEQPDLVQERDSIAHDADNLSSDNDDKRYNHCYTRHLSENNQLCEELYPIQGNLRRYPYPQSFLDDEDNLELVVDGFTFPLTGFVSGATRKCTGIFNTWQASPD